VDILQERGLKKGWSLPPESGASAESPASRSRTCPLQLLKRKRKIVPHASNGKEGCHCSLTRPSALPPSALLVKHACVCVSEGVLACTSKACDHVSLCCSSLSGMDYSCHSVENKGVCMRERERGEEKDGGGVFWRQQAP